MVIRPSFERSIGVIEISCNLYSKNIKTMSTLFDQNKAFCKQFLSGSHILRIQNELVLLLGLDTYHQLVRDKEIETDHEKIDFFREQIGQYIDDNLSESELFDFYKTLQSL